MYRSLTVLALASAALLGGCLDVPAARTATFNPDEYAVFDKPGSGSIVGQAFMTDRAGNVKFGRQVFLTPSTSYSTEWYERNVLGLQRLEPGDASCERFTRSAIADAEGRFQFQDLPAGTYYITSLVQWQSVNAVSIYSGPNWVNEGGVAHAKVTVKNGQVTKAVVTR